MSSGARGLLAIAAFCALIGAGAIAATQATGGGWGAWGEVRAQFGNTFGSGAWGWLWRRALGVSGVAIVLTIVQIAFGLKPGEARHEFESHTGENVQEVIREVRRRIGHCTEKAPDVVAAFSELVRGAVKVAASDIHISPTPDGVKLTY